MSVYRSLNQLLQEEAGLYSEALGLQAQRAGDVVGVETVESHHRMLEADLTRIWEVCMPGADFIKVGQRRRTFS